MLASTIPAILSLVLLGSVSAHPVAETEWYQARDSEIVSLFRRQRQAPAANDPNFASNYPAGGSTPPASSLPKAWTDKLATIQLPAGINPSAPNNGYPTYTGDEKGGDQHICSFTYECTTSEDLVAPRDGVLALSFDDGPTPNSPALYEFLAQNNMSTHATHFMIGSNILYNPTGMQAASNAGGHLAVHTWSHQYTTTLSNEGVLAELGWTMQIIADLNGGRIPKYWRPPFGDVDNRVRAIAKGVFGLETVPWSHDSGDWGVTAGNYPKSQVDTQMEQWITGPKSPGLNILEHEQGENPVNIFITAFPKMVSNGWNILNIAEAWNMDWYVNAASQTSSVTQMAVGGDFVARNSTSASASPSASASSASASASASASVSRASASASNSAASRSASASVSRASAGASPSPTSAAGQSINLVSAGWIVGAIGAAAAVVL